MARLASGTPFWTDRTRNSASLPPHITAPVPQFVVADGVIGVKVTLLESVETFTLACAVLVVLF